MMSWIFKGEFSLYSEVMMILRIKIRKLQRRSECWGEDARTTCTTASCSLKSLPLELFSVQTGGLMFLILHNLTKSPFNEPAFPQNAFVNINYMYL